MKKILVVLVVLAIIILGGFMWARQQKGDRVTDLPLNNTAPSQSQADKDVTNTPASNNTVNTPAEEEELASDHPVVSEQPPAATTKTVSITNDGFEPKSLTVPAGTTVIFKNDGVELIWPASDPHPTHTLLAGFDAERALEPGESWSFKFTVAGTFGYHNHLGAGMKGTIVVE